MLEKTISAQEYEKYLREFVGHTLTDFYYITDRLLVFKAGRKFPDREVVVKGVIKPLYQSEFELRIWGNWKYERNGMIVETTVVQPHEDGPRFRNRIADFAESIHPKKVTAIHVAPSGISAELYLDTGGKFVITQNKDMFINYSNLVFDPIGNVIAKRYATPQSDTGILIYSESP